MISIYGIFENISSLTTSLGALVLAGAVCFLLEWLSLLFAAIIALFSTNSPRINKLIHENYEFVWQNYHSTIIRRILAYPLVTFACTDLLAIRALYFLMRFHQYGMNSLRMRMDETPMPHG